MDPKEFNGMGKNTVGKSASFSLSKQQNRHIHVHALLETKAAAGIQWLIFETSVLFREGSEPT